MKRKIIIVSVICCILVFFITNLTFAADNVNFSLSNAEGKYGDEVTVYLSLNNNSDFVSGDWTIQYDNKKLQYVNYNELEILKTGEMNAVKNNPDNGKIAIGYVADPTSDNWNKAPGKVLSVTFKIITSEPGTTNLTLTNSSLKKDSGERISSTTTNGTVKIGETSNNGNNGNNNNGNNGSNNGNNNNGNNGSNNGNNNNGNNGSNNGNNNNGNNGSNNGNKGSSNGTNNSGSDTKKDIVAKDGNNSYLPNVYPKTGSFKIHIAIFAVLIIISVYFYKRYKKLKDI